VPFNRAAIEETAMLALIGSACTAVAILAVALAALACNHPNAPRWVQRELTAQLCGVVITIVLGLGLACLARTAVHLLADGITLVEAAVLAGGIALVVVTLRTLKFGARLRRHQASAVALVPPV
jgi:hypothetical protein